MPHITTKLSPVMTIAPTQITAVVLCGGRGMRMGGVDKGLQLFDHQPLVLHAIKRLLPQAAQIIINANRNLDAYQLFGETIVTDEDANYAGPLAGFAAALSICKTPYLLTVPCDSPKFPLDLAQRLAIGLCHSKADLAMAAQNQKIEPVFCLIQQNLITNLRTFLQQGGRKIDAWTAQQRTTIVNFDQKTDQPGAFMNINTLEELQLHQLNHLLSA